MQPSSFDTIVVLDFEATCQRGGAPEPQEVIEFPSVLVSLRERAVLDSFSSFVRPVAHPQLSEFCRELTSIRQEDVDGAPVFAEVLARHQAWLAGHGLTADNFAFVTCGDWDLVSMLPRQCVAAGLSVAALPRAYRRWVNIKEVFVGTVRKAKSNGMTSMLRSLGLELVGTHHRGIDDCHNIARIALELAARGATFTPTRRLPDQFYGDLQVVLRHGEQVVPAVLKKRRLPALLGLASGLLHRQMARVFTADGLEITDEEALTELPDGVVLQLIGAREEPPTRVE